VYKEEEEKKKRKKGYSKIKSSLLPISPPQPPKYTHTSLSLSLSLHSTKALQSATVATVGLPCAVCGDGGRVFDSANLHAGSC